MSLDKAIEHGKEHRRPYCGAKATAVSCRNHGGSHAWQCPYCYGNRMYQRNRALERARQMEMGADCPRTVNRSFKK